MDSLRLSWVCGLLFLCLPSFASRSLVTAPLEFRGVYNFADANPPTVPTRVAAMISLIVSVRNPSSIAQTVTVTLGAGTQLVSSNPPVMNFCIMAAGSSVVGTGDHTLGTSEALSVTQTVAPKSSSRFFFNTLYSSSLATGRLFALLLYPMLDFKITEDRGAVIASAFLQYEDANGVVGSGNCGGVGTARPTNPLPSYVDNVATSTHYVNGGRPF